MSTISEEVMQLIENRSRHTTGDLDFAYTFMNEFSAFHSHHCVAIVYIKKLEKELDKMKLGKKKKRIKSNS